MKFFNGCDTLESVKKRYRELCKQYHPDLHGADTEEIMKAINAEYERVFEAVKRRGNTTTGNAAQGAQRAAESPESDDMTAEMFAEIINALIGLDGIEIDIVGAWIWLSGNTYPYRDIVKGLGFKWSKSRKKWYYGTVSGYRKGNKLSYGEICSKYGCQSYTGKASELLQGG